MSWGAGSTHHPPAASAGRRPAGRYASAFLFFFSLFALTNCGFDTSEGTGHYEVAELVVATGSLGFDEPRAGVFTVGPDGRTYSSHEVGNVLFLLPTAAGNRLLERALLARGKDVAVVSRAKQFVPPFQASLYSALTATLVCAILRRHFGLSWRAAFASSLLLATTTFVWTYSRMLFDGVLCGTLLAGSFLCLLEYKQGRRARFLAGAFALLGLGVITRASLVIPVVASFLYLIAIDVHRPGRAARSVALAALTLVPFAAWQLWYNNLRTGDPLLSPVQTAQYAENNGLDGNLVVGLAGLLFSPGKSVFVYAPLAGLSVILFPRFARRFRPEALYLGVFLLLWLLLHAKLRSWYGAWGWGPRHFVTITPFLLLPALAVFPAVRASRGLLAAGGILAGTGFVLALASVVSNWHYRMALAFREGRLADEVFVWGLESCQPVDMLRGAVRNGLVCVGWAEPSVVPEASALNVWASNTVNFWWVTLPRAGIPGWEVGLPLCLLLAVGLLALVRVLRFVPGEPGGALGRAMPARGAA